MLRWQELSTFIRVAVPISTRVVVGMNSRHPERNSTALVVSVYVPDRDAHKRRVDHRTKASQTHYKFNIV